VNLIGPATLLPPSVETTGKPDAEAFVAAAGKESGGDQPGHYLSTDGGVEPPELRRSSTVKRRHGASPRIPP